MLSILIIGRNLKLDYMKIPIIIWGLMIGVDDRYLI